MEKTKDPSDDQFEHASRAGRLRVEEWVPVTMPKDRIADVHAMQNHIAYRILTNFKKNFPRIANTVTRALMAAYAMGRADGQPKTNGATVLMLLQEGMHVLKGDLFVHPKDSQIYEVTPDRVGQLIQKGEVPHFRRIL